MSDNADFGRLLYETGAMSGAAGKVFGRELKRFYENGFESIGTFTRRIPYSDVAAIYYLDQTTKQTFFLIPVVSSRNVNLWLKTFDNVEYREQASGIYGSGSAHISDLEKVRDIIVQRVLERMASEIDEKGMTCWAGDVFLTQSSVVQRVSSGEICIPYGEITGTAWNRLTSTVTIQGSRRTNITIKTHYNLLPGLTLLDVLCKQHGIELQW